MRKYNKDYDLTKISDRDKYARAVNARIANIAKTFGIDSNLYKKAKSEIIRLALSDDAIRYNKDGVVQLSRSKSVLEDNKTFYLFDKKQYLNKPTVGEFIQKTFEKMKERGELDSDLKLNQQLQGPPTKDGIYPSVRQQVSKYAEEVSKLSDDIREDIGYLYGVDDEDALEAINTLQITGRRKTYEELQKIAKATAKAKDMYEWSVDDF